MLERLSFCQIYFRPEKPYFGPSVCLTLCLTVCLHRSVLFNSTRNKHVCVCCMCVYAWARTDDGLEELLGTANDKRDSTWVSQVLYKV